MEYGKLVNRAFALAWRYKILWIFGLFTSFGSANFHNELPNRAQWSDFGRFGDFGRQFQDWDKDIDPDLIAPLVGGLLLVALVIGLIFLIAHLIATPALIDSVNNITRGGRFKFGSSLSRGIDLFWRFLGMFFIEAFAIVGTFFICIVPVVVLCITIIGIPVAIALIFFVIYFWFTLFGLAERAIVARDCGIGDALGEGWTLLKRNWGTTMMMALIYFGLSIVIGLGALVIWLMIALPVGGMVGISTDSTVIGVLVGILVSLPVWILIGGWAGSFFSSLYTMFYFELVEPGSMVERADIYPPPPPAATPDIPSGSASPPTGAPPTDPDASYRPPGPVEPSSES